MSQIPEKIYCALTQNIDTRQNICTRHNTRHKTIGNLFRPGVFALWLCILKKEKEKTIGKLIHESHDGAV
jgi:hypothetical protein